MKILYVGSEVMPFAATGGLGDVLGSLPAAVKASADDCDIRVVMPLYASIGENFRSQMTFVKSFDVALAWRKQYCGIFTLEKDGVLYYFIDNEYYFKRDSIYGSFDDGERYAFFCAAILRMMYEVDFYPDILHANDWQSALSVIYLNLKYRYIEEYKNIRTVFTIHNIKFQGQYDFSILGDVFDLDAKEKGYVEYDGCINLMKGAIILADYVTTVSPTYAKEILTPEYGEGLEGILGKCSGKVSGILNGIDYEYYNPAKNADLAANYTERSVSKKAKNKIAMQEYCGLPQRADVPMYAIISRLTEQKGLDLVKECTENFIAENDVQLVVLGKGEYDYEGYFRYLASKYPDKVSALIIYDRAVSKKLYAACDMFIMPSRTEPCGLSQMIASRYGSVPITRETGGLFDSIKGYYIDESGEVCGNGFTFRNYSAHELGDRMYASLMLYKNKPEWERLVKKVMNTDFSWETSAKQYLDLYKKMV